MAKVNFVRNGNVPDTIASLESPVTPKLNSSSRRNQHLLTVSSVCTPDTRSQSDSLESSMQEFHHQTALTAIRNPAASNIALRLDSRGFPVAESARETLSRFKPVFVNQTGQARFNFTEALQTAPPTIPATGFPETRCQSHSSMSGML